ncbi:MAG: bifunctional nuclease family protein [Chloroflexota bacterium]|nr:bifunctional nuclease family protein [Chloroflexota bacterium]
MIECKIESIRVSLVTQQRVVILKELGSERYLPIWIGPYEADAIALELQEVPVQRPFTHDLLRNVIIDLGASVTHVLINDLHDDTFFARLVLDVQGRHAEVDSRPSDAIALAVRAKCPIFVEEAVMERAGVTLDTESSATDEELPEGESLPHSERADEDRLSVFRDFINSIDMDDLGKTGESPGK